VLTIEHDPMVVRSADRVLELDQAPERRAGS
jgi:hypothetical protein